MELTEAHQQYRLKLAGKRRVRRYEWTDAQTARLQELWGTLSPHDIGRNMGGCTKTAAEVRAKAQELGLNALAAKRIVNRPHQKPVALADGMVEFAPGHVCSPRSYELIKGSRDARQALDG